MSGLVMDDAWIPDVAEYYAVNITGLRLVSPERPKTKKILRDWKRLDNKKYKVKIIKNNTVAHNLFICLMCFDQLQNVSRLD